MAQAAEQAQSSLTTTELLAAAAHELKTPLVIVGSIASAMDNGLYGRLSVTQKRQLRRIDLTTRRLLRVVDGLLGLEKVKGGRSNLNLEPVNMLAIIQSVVDELQPLAEDAGQKVRLQRQTLPPVYADHTFIYQVLFNLVHNALKYSPEGSTITITAQRDRTSINIVISDKGPRLSTDDRRSLFTKFSPLSSRSALPGSNGLGLYLASGLVALLGGQLSHHPGRDGNRFHLTLPVIEQLMLFEGEPA